MIATGPWRGLDVVLMAQSSANSPGGSSWSIKSWIELIAHRRGPEHVEVERGDIAETAIPGQHEARLECLHGAASGHDCYVVDSSE